VVTGYRIIGRALHLGVPDMKEQLYQTLRVLLGRRPIATEEMKETR